MDGAFFDSISKLKNFTLKQIREKARMCIRQEDIKNPKKETKGKIKPTQDDQGHQRDRGLVKATLVLMLI